MYLSLFSRTLDLLLFSMDICSTLRNQPKEYWYIGERNFKRWMV